MRGGGFTRSVWDGTMGARGPLIDCDRTLWREAGCPTESQPVADGVALGVQPARAGSSCGLKLNNVAVWHAVSFDSIGIPSTEKTRVA